MSGKLTVKSKPSSKPVLAQICMWRNHYSQETCAKPLRVVNEGSWTVNLGSAAYTGVHAVAMGFSRGYPKLTLHGIPVESSEALPALGTAKDVVLADWSFYVVGNRNLSIRISGNEPAAFRKNQSVARFVWRGDGQPWVRNKIPLSDGTQTSPFVYLN